MDMDQSDHQPPQKPAPTPAPPRRTSFARGSRSTALAVASTIALILAATATFSLLPQRGGTLTATPRPTLSVTQSVTPTVMPTATPLPPCAQLPGGATPFTVLEEAPDLDLPAGTYITAPTKTGGGVGRYTVLSYMVCFPGKQSDIDGDFFGPGTRPQSPLSSLARLLRLGWLGNHLFPNSYDFASLDHCTGTRECLNDTGAFDPFTFVSVDHFLARSGGLTTFTLQVATIHAPRCLNDPRYYSGTAHYTIFEEGNSPTSGNSNYYFFMPPATRVSTFTGGGTTKYFCSAGTTASVVNFLEYSLQTGGFSLTILSSNELIASKGRNPTYHVAVKVPSPGNYSLRLYTSP